MDKQQAREIVRDTLGKSFVKEAFTRLVKELFNQIDEAKAFHARGYVPESYKKYVKTYERIATYTDPNSSKIDILIVYLQSESTLERARTSQRNFIAHYLKERDQKDAGLVAFVSPDPSDWRFSLVKMDYRFAEGKDGKVKVKEEFTPARRWSFLVGTNENSHTAQSRLAPLIIDDTHNPALAELEEAFNIETVTKEFFTEYRNLFLRVKDSLDAIVAKDANIKNNFEQNGVNTIDFAKKLLGQIVFLYFLQKKGWFGVSRDAAWGTGSKQFLRELFEGKHGQYKNFFNDILEPLFYEALASGDRDDHYYSRFNCKIPFLNGGLFDPINNYDWVHTDILLPAELFSNKLRTKEGDNGNGILDVFDRYNFTVKEDEPLEKEVAVDPEMLGKVFENLLEVKDRKSKGTYYTPREIVHYMCHESLIHYLKNAVADAENDLLFIQGDVETFIRHGELANENDVLVQAKGKETETYSYKLPESIRKHARIIDEKLANIKVCDPAVGSGAFLVGMMTEIVKARQILSTFIAEKNERTSYAFKRQAICNSLYGVDIDPSAAEIAKLRLWLSLVVDEDDIREIKPLPNLDYKIMQGNSLLEEFDGVRLFDETLIASAPADQAEQIEQVKKKQSELTREYNRLQASGQLTKVKRQALDDDLQKQANILKNLLKYSGTKSDTHDLLGCDSQKKAEALKQLHKTFFDASRRDAKRRIKESIGTMEWELIEATLKEQDKTASLKKLEQYRQSNVRPFFLWKFHFAEVFQENGGFDVVIANPPYVRQESIRDIKPQLAKEYDDFYCGTADIYTYFYRRGIDLLKSCGHLCFIAPNKFMRAVYGKNTRAFLTTKVAPKFIIDFGDLPIFDATTYPSIILLEKRKPQGQDTIQVATFTDQLQLGQIEKTLLDIAFPMQLSALREEGWNLEQPDVLMLMEKLRSSGVPLGEYAKGKIYRGITTGCNEAFVIDEETKKKLIKEDKSSAEVIKPFLRGRDIKSYSIEEPGLYLIFTRRGIDIKRYPAIEQHLKQFKQRLTPGISGGRKPGAYKWYEIQDSTDYWEEFEKPKILLQGMMIEPSFVLSSKGYYLNAPANFIGSDESYLLGLLNSRLLWFFHKNLTISVQQGFLRIYVYNLEILPIARPTEAHARAIVQRVENILATKKIDPKADTKEVEREINHLVYELYGLTEEEIVIVEESVKR